MSKNTKRWGLKLLLLIFDIFAVNFSYYIALVLRFYVNHEFHPAWMIFLPPFLKFAPYYTVCCIAVFWFFKLYDSMWRYAGFNDIIRIAAANGVTCLIQIFGTLLFIRRMPITYYVIGAVIQFGLIALSRFSYRLVILERARYNQRRNPLSSGIMIVGAGETARAVLRQFNMAGKSFAKPVCVVDYRNQDVGLLFDGVPVVGGLKNIGQAIEKYGVKCAVIADSVMPMEIREQVREICGGKGVEVQDISVYQQGGDLGYRALLEHTNGALELVLDGKTHHFDNSEQAAKAFAGKYHIKTVSAKDSSLVIELEAIQAPVNNMDETWVHDYEKETGETVSFF